MTIETMIRTTGDTVTMTPTGGQGHPFYELIEMSVGEVRGEPDAAFVSLKRVDNRSGMGARVKRSQMILLLEAALDLLRDPAEPTSPQEPSDEKAGRAWDHYWDRKLAAQGFEKPPSPLWTEIAPRLGRCLTCETTDWITNLEKGCAQCERVLIKALKEASANNDVNEIARLLGQTRQTRQSSILPEDEKK